METAEKTMASTEEVGAVSMSPSTSLLGALKASRYPNCTLYLIWHYLDRGNRDLAVSEYVRDSDKLGQHRRLVERVLQPNGPGSPESGGRINREG